MIKENKKTMILSSIIIMIPMLVGILYYNKLPNSMATHFGTGNEPNGWSSKPFTVFIFPLLLLALQWFCAVMMDVDPKKKNISKKMKSLSLWIVPAVAIVCCVSIYGYALGYDIKTGTIACLFTGGLFIIIGNYLPKCKQSYTVGIKLPWTLSSEKNWNQTHRFAGWLWIICGFVIAINAFYENVYVLFVTIAVMVIVPFVYSFAIYVKDKKQS